MSKFLDETGLAYFWEKIKAALSTVAFTGSYNDLTDKPNIPAGSTVDTVLSSTSENPVQNKVINTALGTKANDSDVVKLTGNQTVGGDKTFTGDVKCEKAYPSIVLNRTYTGSAPSNPCDLRFANNGANEAALRLAAGNGLQLGVKGSGSSWYDGPMLILQENNTFTLQSGYGTTKYKLIGGATGGLTWAGKEFVYTSGNQTIADFKVFTDSLRITGAAFSNINQNIVKGTIPSSDQNRYIYFFDKVNDPQATSLGTAHVMAAIKNLYAKTSGNNSLQLMVYTPTTGGTANKLLSFRATPAGDYAFLPGTNNDIDLGGSSNKWANVYATTFNGALSGNASTATKLAASKTIAISGGATGTATAFDGSGNITIPVTALDVSKASAGTLPVARGGTGLTSLNTFVRTTGDQTIEGTKTFSNTIYCSTDVIVQRNFAFGTWPSSAFVPGMGSKDKNNLTGSWVGFRYDSTLTSLRLYLRKSDDATTSATSLPYVEFAYGKNTAIYAWEPKADNAYYLGYSSSRWKQLYAGTTTIATSDERLKDNIEAVPDAVLDAWGDVNWSQFQFRDSIAEKGEDKARLHNGLVAQRIDAVFKAHGQDASRYGLFCYDEWDATPEEKDEQGNVCAEAKPAGNIYSLRYEEALCMEAAYQRRRADRAEARITALEQRLNELEEVLATLGDHSNAS